jgi:hypothetical protein
MKNRRTFSRLGWLAVLVAMGAPYTALADQITMDLTTAIQGGFKSGDDSSSPYLTATVSDGTNNGNSGVFLTLKAPGLGFAGSGNYEHVNAKKDAPAWLFNLTSTSGLTSSSFTVISASGNSGFTLPTIAIGGSYQAGSSGNFFNLGFAFAEGKSATDGRNGGAEFGFGDTLTYFIQGLSASSFQAATRSRGSLGTYFSAAAIDDAQSGTWIAGTAGAASPPAAAPEPSSLFLSLLGCVTALAPFALRFMERIRGIRGSPRAQKDSRRKSPMSSLPRPGIIASSPA